MHRLPFFADFCALVSEALEFVGLKAVEFAAATPNWSAEELVFTIFSAYLDGKLFHGL